jgi:hypothetical protein
LQTPFIIIVSFHGFLASRASSIGSQPFSTLFIKEKSCGTQSILAGKIEGIS